MSRSLTQVTRAKLRWHKLCDQGSSEYIAAIFAARDAGHTLDAIGEAAGISRQGVHYLLTEHKGKTT